MSDLLAQRVKSSVAVAVVTVVATEVATEVDSVVDAADSVVKEETTSVAVVALEVEILLDLLMATILREVEIEEVVKVSDLLEAATPLPKNDIIFG